MMQKILFIVFLFFNFPLFAQNNINNVIDSFKNRYLVKNQLNYVYKYIPQYRNFMEEKYPNIFNLYNYYSSKKKEFPTIFYFTSASVPKQNFYNILLSINKLKETYQIQSAQIFKDIEFKSLSKYLKKITKNRENNTSLDTALNNAMLFRFDPKSFKKLNITKVPVLAFAMCKGDAYPSDCDIKYIIRGDVSLTKFFFLISEIDNNYLSYYQKLIETQ